MHSLRSLFLAGAVSTLVAMAADAAPATGRVVDLNGQPVPHVSVIVRETLEAARSDEDGAFTVDLPDSGSIVIAAVAQGQDPVDFAVELPLAQPLLLRLQRVTGQAVSMDEVTVMAGDYPTGTVPGAALSAVEVLTTPGALGDVNRALQTMPGVQTVDEGNGLYVRGGEYWETGAFINGTLFPSAVRLEAPTTTFVGTVNPFLTKSISFKSGGFGAEYGNLLSGVVALETQDKPSSADATLNIGLGAVSLGGSTPIGKNFGVSATATFFDLRPMVKVNGSPRDFDPAPHGDDLSASAVWYYRPGAELKVFAIQQTQRLGIDLEEPSFNGFYAQKRRSRFGVLSFKDYIGAAAVDGSFSTGAARSTDVIGELNVEMHQPSTRAAFRAAYPVSNKFGLLAGGDFERAKLSLVGSKPVSFDDFGEGAQTVSVESRVAGTRHGLFVEGDWTPLQHTRVVAGVRTDRSTLVGKRTFDPRISAAYRLAKGIELTAAGGVYHQVPDMMFYNPTLSSGAPDAMRATHQIVGLKFGNNTRQLRIEAYRKDYRDLAQFTRDRSVSENGTGTAEGLDIFARSPLPFGLTGRLTLSLLDAKRTDPDTGAVARSSVGIQQSLTVIVEKAFGPRYKAGVSWRSASGRPITEVVGANYDATSSSYTPVYGDPFAARLPSYHRLDFSITGVTSQSARLLTAWYVSVSNVFGRENASDFTYSADYSQRRILPNTFNRAIYVGFSLIYR